MAQQCKQANPPVVFFDGYCNLCNGAIQWIIQKDSQQVFLFAPLSGEYANNHLPPQLITNVDSIVLLTGDDIFIKSSAAIEIARYLPMPYRLLKLFRIIPAFIRDPLYDLVARYRYRIWGKRESCMIPTPEVKERFLL